jgi:superfamily II DNA or RNA helicase
MIKLPTVVITKGIAIIEQWKESISRFTDGSCQILKPKTVIKEDQNFYICNAINVEKIAKSGLFNKIGLVIVDEAHQIMSEVLSKSLTCITPRYLVGLTATPYRYDGYDALLGLYFGLLSKNNEKQEDTKDSLIYRKLSVPHTVYRIDTGFKPEIEMNSQGKVDWGKVLDSQCSDIDRNELIVKIVKYFDKRVFLILTKRIYQAEYLLRRLKEEEEDVTSLFGSQKTYRGEARILIGTTQKVGTGFDHPRLDTLLLATDTLNYYIQNLGRVCRSPDSRPIFFDLVDDYSLLKRHFSTRKSVYIEHGGRFRNFDEDYPEFD